MTRTSQRVFTFLFILTIFPAQPAFSQGERGRREDPFNREDMLKRFDADGDGALNDAEREKMRDFILQSLQERPGGDRPEGGRPGQPPGGAAGGRGGGPGRQDLEVVAQFDKDGDGKLNDEERARARVYVKEQGSRGRSRRGRRPGGGGEPRDRDQGAPEKLSPADVKNYPGKSLYDTSVLRTIFIEFSGADWETELADFYRTDVEMPIDMTVDGKTYEGVGIQFRGNSSFFGVSAGQKRSFNIRMEYGGHDGLYGYKTLNLLNSHADPSFLRHVLFDHVAGRYLPTSKANYVKLVINGVSWGIYLNIQQYNKDFLSDWYDTKGGIRWKVPANPQRAPGLRYFGENLDDYKSYIHLKTTEAPEASWNEILELSKLLEETPADRVEEVLGKVLNIDRALWFIAIDNLLMDGDGYVSRGSDFLMYQDPGGRINLMPYDSNETFGLHGGGGGPGGSRRGRGRRPGDAGAGGRRPSGPFGRPPRLGGDDARRPEERRPPTPPPQDANRDSSQFSQSPLEFENSRERPLISKLLSAPSLKARYLAHVKTILDESLDWKILGPVVKGYRSVLGNEIAKDTTKLYPTEAYEQGVDGNYTGGRRPVTGIKSFITGRRSYLLKHPALLKPTPSISGLKASSTEPAAGSTVKVSARIGKGEKPAKVLLYHATGKFGAFEPSAMKKSGGAWIASIPAYPAGTLVRYYVEARSATTTGTTTFEPRRAEGAPLRYRVQATRRSGFPVRINEFLAANEKTNKDSEGEYEDWVELYNSSSKAVDLSGLYLSDSLNNPRKWKFPVGTSIDAGGYLVIWLDGDAEAEGLHAGFRLNRDGETILLVDRDKGQNAILDELKFSAQENDRSFGRAKDGEGKGRSLKPTPGKANPER
ncbi:MAG: CotH kinase family protein [Planctomycetota bacterium]|nr:CotH kinase family protein [Planctomycetota bacterium]